MLFCHAREGLLGGLCLSDFQTNSVRISCLHVCSLYPTRLDLFSVTSSTLCNSLESAVTSHLVSPNVLFQSGVHSP
jgi:hypothetical protein